MNGNAISPTRKEDYAEWYQQVIRAADLAENSPVRGCMVIKPWGYAIWEQMQAVLDRMIKATGHSNAYFPLFIPKSFLEREAAHVEGFAKECAVVTHSQLVADGQGGLKVASPLEEELIVRPTSETIIGESFSRWIHSYRDLPLLINQWANVVRWEMRTRLFLRTSEFLWQEGHTAHETPEEAREETIRMLEVYQDFAENYMAMPIFCGKKSERERFPGADETLSIEAIMQDGKALQAGTSHFLGQNFSRACNIRFVDRNGQLSYAWTTSWGVSTRLMGALIMAHSDDNGLVLPPRLAPYQIVILPILRANVDPEPVLSYVRALQFRLSGQSFHGQPLRVHVDHRDRRGGEKAWEWIKKGVPMRVEIGLREVENGEACVGLRNCEKKQMFGCEELVAHAAQILEEIQLDLYGTALQFRRKKTHRIRSYKEFEEFFRSDSGFAVTYFSPNGDIEEKIQASLGVTLRCMPLDNGDDRGPCFYDPQRSGEGAIWARAY